MDGVTHPRQQRKAGRALGGISVIDRHTFKEGVDGRAEGGKRRHSALEILRRHRLRRARFRHVERGDERSFGYFGRVGKS